MDLEIEKSSAHTVMRASNYGINEGFLASDSNIESLLEFCSHLKKNSKFPDRFVFNELLHKLTASNCGTLSLKLLPFFLSKGVGDLELGFKVFRDMKKDRVLLNSIVFTCLINGCFKVGDFEAAFELYREMERAKLALNVVSYTALIDGLCKKGMLERAECLFLRMLEDKVEPNVVVYTSIIDGHFKKRNIRNALKYLGKMYVRGIKLDMKAYGLAEVHATVLF
ncbi:hypothetical protein CCACVL1_23941 [Corchorus capsularis]|uniref:Pentatricopeptide repeat-containing protein n=1 Tax=Corchorus capsularis TaxID=210143 RepID=A0A1R3GRT1_COCAP|nr:hypothetical protein CCACVL1_23941 [Corchorus capsularis]